MTNQEDIKPCPECGSPIFKGEHQGKCETGGGTPQGLYSPQEVDKVTSWNYTKIALESKFHHDTPKY
jgi:uncharacterized Zn finger protein (UPF0148 family)